MTLGPDDKTLFKNEWLALVQRGFYTFCHEVKSDGQGVAILVTRNLELLSGEDKGRSILGRYETCPAHSSHSWLDDQKLCAITGMMEPPEKPVMAAVRELKEEAGYDATPGVMMYIGVVMSSKQSDTIMNLYHFDATKAERGDAPGDGTEGEEGSYCDWITVSQAISCKDPLMSLMMARAGVIEGGMLAQ